MAARTHAPASRAPQHTRCAAGSAEAAPPPTLPGQPDAATEFPVPYPRRQPPWNLDPVDVVAEKHERITTIRLEFELRKQVDKRRQGRT